MADYQRVVDEIRSFLQSTDQTLTDRLKELAADYARGCQEANQRLRRCEEFLQKGLRSEAIHLAQAEPILLDLVATLDFPERSEWEELVFTYGLAAPQKLNLATAEALNEAYTAVQPLEQLLRKHRWLALSHAPLPSRLNVMRQIALIDIGNPVWVEDIREFEKARVRQLEADVQRALQHGDTPALDRIVQEIRATEWTTAPPLQLIQYVENLAKQRDQKRVRERLRSLEKQIHDGVAAFDVEGVRRLRERWNDEAVLANLSLHDPVWDRVSAAFDWLNEQDRRQVEGRKHKAALASLEAALPNGSSWEELDAYYRAAMAHEEGVPEELEGRFRERLEGLKRRARRRKGLLMAGSAVTVFLLAIGIYSGVQGARFESRLSEAVQTVRRLREAGAVVEAKKYLDDLRTKDPRLAEAPALVPVQKQVEEEYVQEQRRVDLFREALEQAKQAPLGENGEEAVTKVRRLARLAEEQRAADRLTRDRQDRRRELQAQRDRRFAEEVNDLRDKVTELERRQQQAPGDPAVAARLRELQHEVSQRGQAGDVSPEVRGLLKPLTDRLNALQKMLGRANREAELADRLSAALVSGESTEEYVKALHEYIDEYPKTSRSQAFQRVLGERALWQEVMDWNRLIRPWADSPLDIPVADARGQADKVAAFLQAHPAFVDRAAAQLYRLCLAAAAQQGEAAPQSAAADLRQLFSGALVKDLWVVEEEHPYYVTRDPEPKLGDLKSAGKDLFHVEYLTGLDGKRAGKNLRVRNITRTYRAPQSEVARMVLRMPANFADRSWEKATLAIGEAIRQSRDMDPLLQLLLLTKVVDLAGRGSYPLAQALAAHREVIQAAGVDLSVPWVKPASDAAERARPLARKVVAKLAPFPPVLEQALNKKRELEAAVGQTYHEPAGWLVRDQGLHWQIRPRGLPQREQALGLLVPGADGALAWRPIGKMAGGQATVQEGAEGLVEGRLVFTVAAGKP